MITLTLHRARSELLTHINESAFYITLHELVSLLHSFTAALVHSTRSLLYSFTIAHVQANTKLLKDKNIAVEHISHWTTGGIAPAAVT